MCVLFTEDIGGILTLEFDDHGNLQFKTEATEADGFYDDIGSALKIKKLRERKRASGISGNVLSCVFPGEDIRMKRRQKKLCG